MNLLRALVVLALALLLQAGLGQIWPGVHRYVDLLLVPVVLYGLGGTQRSAMLIGCVAGLLGDGWFHVGTFGLGGFKLTLYGYALGGMASRLDLDHTPGRMVGGAVVAIVDRLLDPALRGLLDQQPIFPGFVEVLALALSTALLSAVSGSILDHLTGPLTDRSRI